MADDSGTLYRFSLTTRFYSTIALAALYASLTKFPSDYDDEDRLAEDATSYVVRISRWSSLWKSLAMSALDNQSTTINYARALRILNLRDLLSLMEEFRTLRAQPVRQTFFAGGLEECNKTRTYNISGTPQTVFDFNASTDALADIITRDTRNVTTLIRQNTERPSLDQPGHLHRWLRHLPALEILQVFSGDTFEDERVRDAVTNCPNLKSLQIYHWPANVNPDEALSQFVSTISGKGLERLVITHGNSCVRELALSALSSYHGSTLTELEVLDVSDICLSALAMATNITHLRSCTFSLEGVPYDFPNEESCDIVSQFLGRNPWLERLDIGLFGLDKILTPVLPHLKLKYLSITDVLETVLPDSFWNAINSQSSSLELLALKTVNRYPELVRPSAKMINSIRLLYKLKVLNITAFSVVVNDWDVREIVQSCPMLEDFYLASPSLSNRSLLQLASLPNLTNFAC